MAQINRTGELVGNTIKMSDITNKHQARYAMFRKFLYVVKDILYAILFYLSQMN